MLCYFVIFLITDVHLHMYLVTLETVPSDTCFAVEKKLAFWDIPLNMSQVAAAFFFFFLLFVYKAYLD